MAIPALRIPVSVPMDQMQQDMTKGISITRTATKAIVQNFVMANKEILAGGASTTALLAGQWQGLSASSLASSLATKLAFVAAFAVIAEAAGALVRSVREQLQNVLEIADKAAKAGVDPQFFQTFVAGARDAKVSVKDLEEALAHASEQIKPALSSSWDAWDGTKRKITEVENKMLEFRELFNTSQNFSGLDLFRRAGSNEDRIVAVLTYMVQLEAIGERLAALDLGEKMFGAKFADNIRQGNTSAEALLATLEKFKDGGGGVWSGKLVEETKEIDRLLKQAHETLSRELAPQFETLVGVANEIKSAWTGVVDTLARAVALLNSIPGAASSFFNTGFGANVKGGLLMPWRTLGLIDFPKDNAQPGGDLAAQAGLGDIGKGPALNPLGAAAGAASIGIPLDASGNPAMPRRRPLDAPKPEKDEKKEVAETTDAFDAATAAIGRHIATLTADAAAVGLTATAHEQLRVEVRLLEAARQSGTAITDEQIAAYSRLRREMGAEQALAAAGIKLTSENAAEFGRLSIAVGIAADNLDRNKRAFAGVNDAVRFGGNQLIDVIDRASQKGAKFGDIMADVMRAVGRQMLQVAITGEGAFAKLFGTASQTGGVGGLGGLIAGLFKGGGASGSIGASVASTGINPGFAIGGAAEGATIPPGGLAIISEHAPGGGRLVRAPRNEPLMVTPHDIASSGGSGGSHTVTVNIGLDGANGDDAVRRIAYEASAQGVRVALSQIPGIAVKAVNEHSARMG